MGAPLGLIAGKGDLAAVLIRKVKSEGRLVVVVTFDKNSRKELSKETENVHYVGLGQVAKVIKTFRDAKVCEVAFVGKVDKRVLFENPRFDLRALSLLKNLEERSDDAIMLAIVAELEKEGLPVASQMDLFKELFPRAGVLSRRPPNKRERADVEFGMKMARGIAALDIGQTVVVRDSAVVAVEAIEGTDETIERGGRIAKKGAVVCKVSKLNQDPRFDVPTVGIGTVETMIRVKASALAIEGGATLVVDLPAMARLCGRNKIAFIAV